MSHPTYVTLKLASGSWVGVHDLYSIDGVHPAISAEESGQVFLEAEREYVCRVISHHYVEFTEGIDACAISTSALSPLVGRGTLTISPTS